MSDLAKICEDNNWELEVNLLSDSELARTIKRGVTIATRSQIIEPDLIQVTLNITNKMATISSTSLVKRFHRWDGDVYYYVGEDIEDLLLWSNGEIKAWLEAKDRIG